MHGRRYLVNNGIMMCFLFNIIMCTHFATRIFFNDFGKRCHAVHITSYIIIYITYNTHVHVYFVLYLHTYIHVWLVCLSLNVCVCVA